MDMHGWLEKQEVILLMLTQIVQAMVGQIGMPLLNLVLLLSSKREWSFLHFGQL